MTDSQRPVAAVIAVVVRHQEVLLVRRANPPDAGLWGFPGGKIHPGETLSAAALRELGEETGIVATAGPVVTAVDALDYDAAGQLRHHFILVAVRCHWQEGEAQADDDALEARWFGIAPLFDAPPPLSDGVLEVLRLALDSSVA